MSIVAKHSTDKVSVICLFRKVDILVTWFPRAISCICCINAQVMLQSNKG